MADPLRKYGMTAPLFQRINHNIQFNPACRKVAVAAVLPDSISFIHFFIHRNRFISLICQFGGI
jgi:hypothetical protein